MIAPTSGARSGLVLGLGLDRFSLHNRNRVDYLADDIFFLEPGGGEQKHNQMTYVSSGSSSGSVSSFLPERRTDGFVDDEAEGWLKGIEGPGVGDVGLVGEASDEASYKSSI
jgi:hypothetical protein